MFVCVLDTGIDITVVGAIIIIAFGLIEIIKLSLSLKIKSCYDKDLEKKIEEIHEVLCGKDAKLKSGFPKFYFTESDRVSLEFILKNTRIIKGMVDKKSTKVRE
jgi:hypothetical protein